MNKLIGVEQDQLPTPEPFERPIILDDGRSRLLERGYLSVDEDHYQIEPQLEAMLATLTQPQVVLRSWRSTPDRDEALWCWYFISGPDLIQLITNGPEQYELNRLTGNDAVLAQIGEILPLEPMPTSMGYRAMVDQEDAELIRALANDWDQVPALTIMEADGLEPVEAIELFDDVAEPRWRGQVDFFACNGGEVTVHHRLLALQGQERSWLAWQKDPDKSELHIQSASAGAFQQQIQAYWSAVSQ